MPTNISTTAMAIADFMDKAKRRETATDPRGYARSAGMDVEGKEVGLTKFTKDTGYFPIYKMSGTGNETLSSAELGDLVAVGTAGSASSVGALCGTVSSGATASSV